MNRTKQKLAGLMTSTVLGFSAQATTVGYDAPLGYWDRGDAGTAYAIFDTFTDTTGSVATAIDSAGFTGLDLTQDSGFVSGFIPPSGFNPAGIYGNGDRIYTHDNSVDFSLQATASFAVKTVIAQIKQYQSLGYSFDAPTLNGIAADFSQTVALTEDDQDASVTTFAWFDSLASESLTALSLNLTADGTTFVSIDGIQIDASGSYFAVPEPASAGLLTAMMSGLAIRRRRLA